jgi:hypothetical protein
MIQDKLIIINIYRANTISFYYYINQFKVFSIKIILEHLLKKNKKYLKILF